MPQSKALNTAQQSAARGNTRGAGSARFEQVSKSTPQIVKDAAA